MAKKRRVNSLLKSGRVSPVLPQILRRLYDFAMIRQSFAFEKSKKRKPGLI